MCQGAATFPGPARPDSARREARSPWPASRSAASSWHRSAPRPKLAREHLAQSLRIDELRKERLFKSFLENELKVKSYSDHFVFFES